MQIRSADTAGTDPDAHTARAGRRILVFPKLKWRTGRHQDHGLHRICRPHVKAVTVSIAVPTSLIRVKSQNQPYLYGFDERERSLSIEFTRMERDLDAMSRRLVHRYQLLAPRP
jgi:hypothetical protein